MSQAPASQPWDESAWARWAVGLYVPCVDPYDRIATLDSMRAQAQTHRERAITVMSGALADILDSLPDADLWRTTVNEEGFGTWEDGADLMPQQVPDVREDIGLAGLARPLETDSVALMAAGFRGWKAAVAVAQGIEEPIEPLARAIEWATWRRNAYQGQDEWPVLALFLWINLAEGLEHGKSPDDDFQRADQKKTAKLPDDLI